MAWLANQAYWMRLAAIQSKQARAAGDSLWYGALAETYAYERASGRPRR